MAWLTIVTMLALVELAVFSMLVGRARMAYGIKAPATTGNEMFERYYRVHYNTIEQLLLFVPGLWAFGHYVSDYWAAGIGVVYLLGRIIYAVGYISDPEKRGPGLMISLFPCWILVLGGLIGAIVVLVKG